MRKSFYITTPIYYPSDRLHVGHAYTTVAADALARYWRARGVPTWFLTGTDEHGINIQRRAEARGISPKQWVDEIVERNIKPLWRALRISYDDFIRTTEPRHQTVVQEIFNRLHEQGDIYRSEYEGWYCAGCESFYTETQAKDTNGVCPDHDRPYERLKEASYFFRLSRYADRLLSHIEQNPEFIQPASRRNEVTSFIEQGLEDLCVSRASVKWGIPVSFDPEHVIYVWIDALSNYVTAIGYLRDEERFRKWWPADVHLIGKEILRFHAIIWPIILMALDLPLPKKVFGHGWLVLESGKMSKTRGNVVDPFELIEKYGLDAVRYYLLREVPFGSDGVYTEDALVLRTNVDLANDLGNLLSRTTAMIERFSGGVVPGRPPEIEEDELRLLAGEVIREVEAAMDRLELQNALVAIWRLVNRANKYIEEKAPWQLDREGRRDELHHVLYNLAETLRVVAVMLVPFLVETPEKIWEQLGLDGAAVRTVGWESARNWGELSAATLIRRGQPLFPRLERPPTDATGARAGQALGTDADGTGPRAGQSLGATADGQGAVETATNEAGVSKPHEVDGLISIDDFARVELRSARVRSAERVAGADRLLRLVVDDGQGERQIVSGIAQHYAPEELVGRTVVLVANLRPAKVRGVESHGMLLAASAGDQLRLVTLDGELAPGARVK